MTDGTAGARADEGAHGGEPAGGHTPPASRVVVVGTGVMGEGVLPSLLAAGVPADGVVAVVRREERARELTDRHGVATSLDARAAVAGADVVVLAVKPVDMGAVVTGLAPALPPGALVLTVAAGLPASFYEARLPSGTPVVRVMPNTPALVGRGATAIAPGAAATGQHLETAAALLAATGLVVTVAEKDLDAVTAVAGSAPAYVFALVDALAEAGVLLGLPRARSLELATAAFRGAVALLDETGEPPSVLREQVTSPGGTTAAGLRELDERAVRAAMIAAAVAVRDRSRELADELGGNAGEQP